MKLQDSDKRMSTWLLRSGSMNKIDGKNLVVLLTIHSSGVNISNGSIGKASIIVKSGTDTNQVTVIQPILKILNQRVLILPVMTLPNLQWYPIISEGGDALKGSDGKQSAVQLQLSYLEKEIETPLC